jgi:hypothetical protein
MGDEEFQFVILVQVVGGHAEEVMSLAEEPQHEKNIILINLRRSLLYNTQYHDLHDIY